VPAPSSPPAMREEKDLITRLSSGATRRPCLSSGDKQSSRTPRGPTRRIEDESHTKKTARVVWTHVCNPKHKADLACP
jgi:hypothetical protein